MFHLMKLSFLSVALMLAAAAVDLHSQTTQSRQTAPATPSITPNSAWIINGNSLMNCPVGVSAQMNSGGGVLTARDGRGISGQQSGDKPAQHIRLILDATTNKFQKEQQGTEADPRPIHAKVTVRGTSPTWRVLNSSTSTVESAQPRRSPWIEKTLDMDLIAPASGNGNIVHADLDLPGFTSVQSIRLDSVAYADGTSWTPISGRACRVAPDPFMLVSSR